MWLTVLHFGALVALAVGTRGVWDASVACRCTTLRTAWAWALPAVASWWIAWAVAWPVLRVPPRVSDHLWYVTVVLTLCPLIAVLGSRRPTVRIWSAFVVLPLLVVLEWPAVSAHTSWSDPRPLDLEPPAFVAVLVVLVMGLGNYLPTRFAAASGLLGLAVCVSLLAFADVVRGPTPVADPLLRVGMEPRERAPDGRADTNASSARGVWLSRAVACGLTGLALCSARRQGRAGTQLKPGFDRLWSDFRDWFGIVWARRLQDRVNAMASQKRWPVRLEMDTLCWSNEAARTDPDAAASLEQAFRWLLRRFVDEQWIDARLASTTRNSGHVSTGRDNPAAATQRRDEAGGSDLSSRRTPGT